MSDANNADDLKEELARQLHMVAMLKERIEEHKLALRESHEREDALRKQLGDTYVALIAASKASGLSIEDLLGNPAPANRCKFCGRVGYVRAS